MRVGLRFVEAGKRKQLSDKLLGKERNRKTNEKLGESEGEKGKKWEVFFKEESI